MPAHTIEYARQALQAGDIEGARRACADLLNRASAGSERAAVQLVLSACHRKQGDLAAALSAVRDALEEAPRDALAHYALAEIQEAQSDRVSALASARRAVEIDPRFVPGWQYLGILLGESGEALSAAAAFEKAVALDPAHARACGTT